MNVTVSMTQTCRIILNWDTDLTKSYKFVTIFPRIFGINEEQSWMDAMKLGINESVPVGHFTLFRAWSVQLMKSMFLKPSIHLEVKK